MNSLIKLPLVFCTTLMPLWSSVATAQAEDALTVLVTGANRGLGLEHARQWVEAGHKVIGTARKPDEAKELKATDAEVVKLDITSDEDIAQVAKMLEGKKLDILINNAGYLKHGKVTREVMMKTFKVNTAGPLLLAYALEPSLKLSKNPKIVNISSSLGVISRKHNILPAYSISKAGLNMATANLHGKLHEQGFVVISLDPGHNKTAMGGKNAPLDPADSVRNMTKLIMGLEEKHSGGFFDQYGKEKPW